MKKGPKVFFTLLLFIFFLGCDSNSPEVGVQRLNGAKTVEIKPTSQPESPKPEYDSNLRKENEELIFSFKTKETNNVVSICISKKSDYIVYRFGTKEKVELEFPSEKQDSWKEFVYSSYLRGGGKENAGLDLNSLSFKNKGYSYEIYEEYSAQDGSAHMGIRITNQKTQETTEIEGLNESKVGSLIILRDSKVNKASE